MTTEQVIERPLLRRVSWGALFAGFFIGMATWLMMLLLIAAIGLSAVNPRNLGSWADVLQAIGIWGGIAGIVATFVGGWCAGRLCGTAERTEGALHGATVWGIALVALAWTVTALVSTAVTGAAAVAGQAASAIGGAAPALGTVSQEQITRAAAAAVNGYLTQNGRQPLPPQQIEAATRDVTAQALQRIQAGDLAGALDERAVTAIVARDTDLSEQDAQGVAQQLSAQLRSVVGAAGQGAQTAAANVGQAAASGGRAVAWGGFIFAVLTMLAAILGGALAISDTQRRRVARREQPVRTGPLRPQEV